MKHWSIGLIALMCCGAAQSADFDGSKMLICAPIEAMDCASGDGCERKLPEEVGAPAFMRVDVQKKVVIGPKQTSPILLIDKDDEQILLQGKERTFGWTISLDQDDGRMVATLVDHQGAFVLFGSCTPL
jgi:hypothetical protein